MRKLAVVITSGLLLGGVFSPAAWAHKDKDDDFTLTGRFTDFDKEDHGRDGWSQGDVITFEYDLFDHGNDAGDGDGTCEITELDRRDREFAADCELTFDLDDGKLNMEGEVTDEDFRSGEIVLDVVDGTGDFDDAQGQATFSRLHHGHNDRRHHGGDHDRDFRVDVDLD